VLKQCATYRWKTLDKGYNFALNLIAIEVMHAKLCTLKIAEVLAMGIWGLPLGSLGTKIHLDVAPWRGIEYTIGGKVLPSLKSGLW
jgi:hypothetical protein